MKDTSALLARIQELETEIEKVKDQIDPPKKTVFARFVRRPLRFLSDHWGVIASMVIALFIYWKYGISYFEPQKNIALAKRTSESYVQLGDQLTLNGQFPAARQAYDAALKVNPNNVEATRGAITIDVIEPLPGQKYVVPEVEEEKVKHLELVLNRAPEKTWIERFRQFLSGAKDEDKTYIVSYFKGTLAEGRRDYDEAKASYLESITKKPEFIQGYIALAFDNLLAGDRIDLPIATLKEGWKHNPHSAIALNNLAFWYVLKLKFDVAKCLYEEADRISPYLDTYINLGDTYRFLGDTDNALRYHKAALNLIQQEKAENENSIAGTMAINFMPTTPGDTETTKDFITVNTLEEKKALAHYELTLDYAAMRDLDNANKSLANASQLDPDKQYLDFVKNKAMALVRFSEQPMLPQTLRWFKSHGWVEGDEKSAGLKFDIPAKCSDVAILLSQN